VLLSYICAVVLRWFRSTPIIVTFCIKYDDLHDQFTVLYVVQ
jgi:hypothetical protein